MNEHRTATRWLGAFKVAKGVLMAAAGAGALALVHRDVPELAGRALEWVHLDPEGKWAAWVLAKAGLLDARRLREVGAGSFVYSVILLTEGIGLLLVKIWAEYLTVIASGLLIPLELWGIARHPSPGKLAALAVNVAIVWYLWRQIQAVRPGRRF